MDKGMIYKLSEFKLYLRGVFKLNYILYNPKGQREDGYNV